MKGGQKFILMEDEVKKVSNTCVCVCARARACKWMAGFILELSMDPSLFYCVHIKININYFLCLVFKAEM